MKIIVTGLGAHCALGENIEILWEAIEQGNSGIAPINRFNVDAFPLLVQTTTLTSSCEGNFWLIRIRRKAL